MVAPGLGAGTSWKPQGTPPGSNKMNKPQKNQAGQEEGAGEGEGGSGFFPESTAEVTDQGQAQGQGEDQETC